MKAKLFFLGLFLLLVIVVLSIVPGSAQEEFSREIWRASSSEADPPRRLQMVSDLLDRGLLAGLSREEVIELLGPPAKANHFKDYDLMYRLGGKGLIFKSPFYFALQFEDDRFHSAKVLQD